MAPNLYISAPCASRVSGIDAYSYEKLNEFPSALVLAWDGTGFDKTWQDRISVVGVVADSVDKDVNAVLYIEGVGSKNSAIDAKLGGLLGFDVHERALRALRFLTRAHPLHPEWKIYSVAWSRGALSETLFLIFLDRVGLPPANISDDELIALYRAVMIDGGLNLQSLRDNHHCREIVVEAQANFDMVATYGWPKTGYFKYRPTLRTQPEYKLVQVPKIVKYTWNGAALQDNRHSFANSLFYLGKDNHENQILVQPWLTGSHADSGVERNIGGGSLNDAWLACAVSFLKSAGLRFNEEALDKRFHKVRNSESLDFISADVEEMYRGIFKFGGWKPRGISQQDSPDVRMNQSIHWTADYRDRGMKEGDPVVPLYGLVNSAVPETAAPVATDHADYEWDGPLQLAQRAATYPTAATPPKETFVPGRLSRNWTWHHEKLSTVVPVPVLACTPEEERLLGLRIKIAQSGTHL